MKYVYFFGAGKAEGDGDMRELLGGKGAGLAEMTRIGLPVPAGFTITTEACDYYLSTTTISERTARRSREERRAAGKAHKKKLGDAKDPLLVSVRSGSARSMPGMMETILNLGLNDKSVEGLAKRHQQRALRLGRLSPLRSNVFQRRDRPAKEDLEAPPARDEAALGVKDDTASPARAGKSSSASTSPTLRKRPARISRKIPIEQLWGAIGAVFDSWMARESRHLPPRREHHRPARHRRQRRADGFRQHRRQFRHRRLLHARPCTGEKTFYGDFLLNAQGEDVVAGIRTPMHLTEMKQLHAQGLRAAGKSSRKTREALSRHAGHGVHRRRRASSTCCRRAPASARPPRPSTSPWTWPTRSSSQGRSP